MGIVKRLLSLTKGLREGDVDVSASPSVDTSALESISDGDGAPESVAGYDLDMDSSINVRWKGDGNVVECSHTGELWNTKISDGERTVVVSSHGTRQDAVEAAVDVMNGRVEDARGSGVGDDGNEEVETDAADMREEDETGTGSEDGGRSEFEQEVESILEDVDTESIEEVNEAFGD